MTLEILIDVLKEIQRKSDDSKPVIISTDGYYLDIKRILDYPEKIIVLLDDGITKIGENKT